MSVVIASKPTPQRHNDGRYHWTMDALTRAIDAGVFDEPKRLELVHGELWEKEIVKPPHAAATRAVARILRRLLEPAFLVISEQPLHISDQSEPIPDVFVVAGTEADYQTRHPEPDDVRLLIEVADTTFVRDTNEKARLYAEAGIIEYWVVALNQRALFVFRSSEDAPPRLTEADFVSPLTAPETRIAVADLLPTLASAAAATE